ncbi:hypothetical protein T06_851 [Trichinella sp. T6]|nr:hypothetical protein T06_851 [Trichinella sp. T6]
MDVMLLKFHENQDCEIYRITNYTHELKRLLKTEAGLLKTHTKSEIHSKTLTEYMIEEEKVCILVSIHIGMY